MGNKNSRPIVFFNSVVKFGGSIKSTVVLIEELRRKGVNVFVLDGGGYCAEYIETLQRLNIPHHVVLPNAKRLIIGSSGIMRLWRMMLASVELVKIIIRLRKKLLQLNPSAIWVNSEKSMFCVGRAVGNRFPTVIFIRGKHHPLKWFCIRDWKNLGAVVGNNAESLEFFKQFEYTRGKLSVAYNGIDYDSLQKEYNLSEVLPAEKTEALKIVMPAMLIPLKAHNVAIEGLAKLRQKGHRAVLWICGDTPNELPKDYEDGLHKLCRELKVENDVYFLGWRSDVVAIMQRSDLLILTSTTEGLPRSILEAMATGLPVIATKVGGVPEIIRDGVDGILVDSGDSDAIAEALERFLNPSVRSAMGQAARKNVRENFTIQKQAEDFLACVEKSINARVN